MRTKVLLAAISIISVCALRAEAESDYETILNISYRTGDALTPYMRERCKLDLYKPIGVTDFPTVVWFHGGGMVSGEKSIPDELMNQGIAIVSANYRLSPGVESPAYVQDAAAAVAWAFHNIELHGGNSRLIFVAGMSAGGYLTNMVGLDKRWLLEYEIDADSIAGLIPLSGHSITHFTVRKEEGYRRTQPIVDDMAPLYHVRGNAPPILLITGDRDLELLGRYEETAYFWRMLKIVEHPDVEFYELEGFNHSQMQKPALPLLVRFIHRVASSVLSDSRDRTSE